MGGEDFSAYQQRAPSTFFYVRARNERRGLIPPRFDVDTLEVGVEVFAAAAMRLLQVEKSGA